MSSRPLTDLDLLPPHHRSPAEIERLWKSAVESIHGIFDRILVLDDDPTGSQTIHGLPVYTGFSPDDLRSAAKEPAKTVFVLTNSRSLDPDRSRTLHEELMRNWLAATDRQTLVLSRSDSTLRGHYPLETDIVRSALETAGSRVDGEFLIPCFPEGGRYTFGDVHYVREGDRLVPAGETEFARDSSFPFSSSDLKDYIAEKSAGAVRTSDVISISLTQLRCGSVDELCAQIAGAPGSARLVVNAVSYDDLKVFAAVLAGVVETGRRYVFRSSAALVKILAGVDDRPLLTSSQLFPDRRQGAGVLIAGSYVGRTTRQLSELIVRGLLAEVKLNIRRALVARDFPDEIRRAQREVSEYLAAGQSVCIFTTNGGRRDFLYASEGEEGLTDLELSARISSGLVELVNGLESDPAWILTKGGITSHDIAVRSLRIRRAIVLGQILPGVPVWRTGGESRWPGIPLVIFPGNVGGDDALLCAVEKLTGSDSC